MQVDRTATLKKWNKWLAEIKREVAWLRWNQKMDRRVFGVILSNPSINKWNPLYDWMSLNYATYATVTLRRLLDTDQRDKPISLANLVLEISSHPQLITRKEFVARFDQSFRERGVADKCFDDLGGGQEFVDSSRLLSELNLAQDRCCKVKKHVDKRIAHHDCQPPKQAPTWEELDVAIETVSRLYSRVSRLLTGIGSDYSEIHEQYDWKWVFRQPWIEPGPEDAVLEEGE